MNPSIILAGQQPDVLNTLARADAAAQQKVENNRQNALAQLYQDQGAKIAAGDQNALNALAGFDPNAAIGIQQNRANLNQTQQTTQFDAEKMQMLRDDAKAKAAQAAVNMTKEQKAAEAEQLQNILRGASQFYAKGDRAGYEQWLKQHNVDPSQYQFDQFPAHAATMAGVFDVLTETMEGPSKDTEAEREIQRLTEIGIPRDVAIRIKEGVYKTVLDPITREVQVVDLSTRRKVDIGQGGEQPVDPSPATAEQPVEQPTAVTPGRDAFGVEGIIKNTVNQASDAVGLGMPYPAVDSTIRDFDVLRESLTSDLAGGYNRQPPSWLMKNIQELTPKAGSLSGPDAAANKLKAISRDMEREAARLEKESTRRMSPSKREEHEARVAAVASALNRVNTALQAVDGGAENVTSGGVKWRVK